MAMVNQAFDFYTSLSGIVRFQVYYEQERLHNHIKTRNLELGQEFTVYITVACLKGQDKAAMTALGTVRS